MLQAVDAKIAAERRRRAALEELFKTLLHALMSGRIRVPHIVGESGVAILLRMRINCQNRRIDAL